jgi:OmpA-OmpF porin, OOP family
VRQRTAAVSVFQRTDTVGTNPYNGASQPCKASRRAIRKKPMNRSLASRRLLALSTLSLLMAVPAWSQGSAYPSGPYIGLSVGQSRASLNERSLAERQLNGSGPIAITALSNDGRDTAYRLFLGYQYSRMLALEAGYFDLGRFGLQANTAPVGQLDGRLKTQGGSLDLVGTLPLSNSVDFLLRAGAQYARTRSQFNGTGAVLVNSEPSAKRWNYKAGVGMQFAFSPNFLMRVEAEQLRVPNPTDGQMRMRVYSVSAVFPFGTPVSAPRAAAQPAVYRPVVMAEAPPPPPPPPPVMAPAPRPAPPPVVELRRVTFNSESLFGFDKSSIRPEGKQALDGFARELSGTQFSVINVEGHADRLGSDNYNQALSQRRADEVKAYLISNGGVMPDKISSKGMGESMPVTQLEDCKASLGTMALRACLQPDRRVDVVVNGTR